MNTIITVDRAGRLVLPKPVREKLNLGPGDSLELQSSENEVVLRPLRGKTPLRKKQGMWVFGIGKAISGTTVNETVAKVREERDRHNLGVSR